MLSTSFPPLYLLRNRKSSQHIFRYNALGQARGSATVNKIRSTLKKVLVSGRTYLVDQYKAGKNNSPPPESAAHMPPSYSYTKRPIICLQNKGPANSKPGVVSQLWQVVPIILAQKQSMSFLTSPKVGLNHSHVCLAIRTNLFSPLELIRFILLFKRCLSRACRVPVLWWALGTEWGTGAEVPGSMKPPSAGTACGPHVMTTLLAGGVPGPLPWAYSGPSMLSQQHPHVAWARGLKPHLLQLGGLDRAGS